MSTAKLKTTKTMSQNNTNNPKSSDSYPPHGQWTTGFNDYCDDPSICFKVCCLPCIPMGQVAEIVDKGSTSCFAAGLIFCILNPKCCGKLYAYSYRSKLRALFSLPEAPHSDFLAHCCCCLCAQTQEYRELKNRGIDPSLGWKGNVEKWKREGVALPPIVAPSMTR